MTNLVLAAIHDIERNMEDMNGKCGGSYTVPVVPAAPKDKPKKEPAAGAVKKPPAVKKTAAAATKPRINKPKIFARYGQINDPSFNNVCPVAFNSINYLIEGVITIISSSLRHFGGVDKLTPVIIKNAADALKDNFDYKIAVFATEIAKGGEKYFGNTTLYSAVRDAEKHLEAQVNRQPQVSKLAAKQAIATILGVVALHAARMFMLQPVIEKYTFKHCDFMVALASLEPLSINTGAFMFNATVVLNAHVESIREAAINKKRLADAKKGSKAVADESSAAEAVPENADEENANDDEDGDNEDGDNDDGETEDAEEDAEEAEEPAAPEPVPVPVSEPAAKKQPAKKAAVKK
jgi:hypothetical protein